VKTDSGLWLPHGFNFLDHRKTVRTVNLPNGKRAKVTVDDSGTVLHQEDDTGICAVVRPRSVRIEIRNRREAD
jgi:hypothetical protein